MVSHTLDQHSSCLAQMMASSQQHRVILTAAWLEPEQHRKDNESNLQFNFGNVYI